MRLLDNVEEIELVEFEIPFFYTCPISGKPSNCIVKVEFSPDKFMFDFDEFEDWVYEKRGEVLTIEGVSKLVRDFMFDEYAPKSVTTYSIQENYYQNFPARVTTKTKTK